jgi:hypothetical protein
VTGEVDGGKGMGPEVARDVAGHDGGKGRRVRGATEHTQSQYCGDFVKDIGANKKVSWASGPPMRQSVQTDVWDKVLLFSKLLIEVNQKTMLRVGESKHHIFQI